MIFKANSKHRQVEKLESRGETLCVLSWPYRVHLKRGERERRRERERDRERLVSNKLGQHQLIDHLTSMIAKVQNKGVIYTLHTQEQCWKLAKPQEFN